MDRKHVAKNEKVCHAATKGEYVASLEHDCQRFLLGLRQYPTAKSKEERERLVSTMDRYLHLMLADVPEIQRRGISKELVIVEKAYQAYRKEPTIENYAALDHAIETLRLFNC